MRNLSNIKINKGVCIEEASVALQVLYIDSLSELDLLVLLENLKDVVQKLLFAVDRLPEIAHIKDELFGITYAEFEQTVAKQEQEAKDKFSPTYIEIKSDIIENCSFIRLTGYYYDLVYKLKHEEEE